MKIIIVMTYFDRLFQLQRTLKSIAGTSHENFEVIIVDDCSNEKPEIGISNFPIEIIRTKNKKWLGGAPALNFGIGKALKKNPDAIILQCAETYHVGDVIKYAEKITDKNYISFACYNLSKQWTFQKEYNLSWIIANYNKAASNNENNAWLNHKTIRQMGYSWCSVITADNMRKLNGFNEKFSEAYCFEDDEFLARVKMLGLEIEITDFPFVVHQWHERNYVPANWNELFQINRKLFEQVKSSGELKAKHKFTKEFYV